jgi:hypothetical protein
MVRGYWHTFQFFQSRVMALLCAGGYSYIWMCNKWSLWNNKVLTSFRLLQQFLLNLVVFLRARAWGVQLWFCGCNKWLSGRRTKYWPGLQCFNNSCLIFLWFSFALGDTAMVLDAISNRHTGRQSTRPGLRPFNNSCLVFAADVLDVNFSLELDAGLAEWDFGAIDLVMGNNKVKPVYKHKQRYVPSIGRTWMEKLLVTSNASSTRVILTWERPRPAFTYPMNWAGIIIKQPLGMDLA